MFQELLWGFRYLNILILTRVYTNLAYFRLWIKRVKIDGPIEVYGWPRFIIHPDSKVNIGCNVILYSGYVRNVVGGDRHLCIEVEKKGQLNIGNGVKVSNSTIVCFKEIVIEDDVFIGGGCNIYDTDFHPITPRERIEFKYEEIKNSPIRIKSKSFIGGHSIILKGVTIGEGAVIGAGSVVCRDVPDFEIWAGNPIKFIKKIPRHQTEINNKIAKI
jgi:acetyltransferase-like isoleucine patch superfamily enzyme